jgi:site-specific recombinase XerD
MFKAHETFSCSGDRRPARKAATISRYKPVLDGFLAFIGERRARASIGSITTGEVERFRNQQIAQGKTATTANLAVKILRAVFNSARRLGVALTNLAEGVKLLSESEGDERLPLPPTRFASCSPRPMTSGAE